MKQYEPYHLPLNKGDLIAVAYMGEFFLGVFLEYGKKGNIRYHILYRANEIEEITKYNGKLYVDYLTTDATYRVIRIDVKELTQNQYINYISILKYINVKLCN
jgi:hypothetical protein